jgi:hypothetical protein
MRRIRASLCFVVGFVVCCTSERPDGETLTSGASVPSAGDRTAFPGCSSHTISSGGVGAVRLGMTADSLRAICNVVHDSIELRTEGGEARVLAVVINGDTLDALVYPGDDATIAAIEVTEPSFTTVDSLGIGTTVGRLARVPGVVGRREGPPFVVRLPELCGVGFYIDEKQSVLRSGDFKNEELDARDLRRFSALPVYYVEVVACT